MPPLSEVLAAAQLIAIERLVRIVRDSPSDREARMAAVALLKMKPTAEVPSAPAIPTPSATTTGPTPPAPHTPPEPPLTHEELNLLHRRLPHLRPERFKRKSPTYWRSMLTEPSHHPLRQAG